MSKQPESTVVGSVSAGGALTNTTTVEDRS
jgi:hypothetical protein